MSGAGKVNAMELAVQLTCGGGRHADAARSHSHSWGIVGGVGMCMGWCIGRTDSLLDDAHLRDGDLLHQGIHQRRREGHETFSPAGMHREIHKLAVRAGGREA